MDYAKEKFSMLYVALTLTFCTCLIISNLVEIKTISLGWLTITGGVLVFPISYVINDCITEVYGYHKAKVMIWMGFFSSLAVTLMLQLVLALPGSQEWTMQQSMEDVYGSVPRIMLASYVAFLCGSMLNAFTMSYMKRRVQQVSKSAPRRYGIRFAVRAIVSTVFGEGLDSLIFFPIAFSGVLSGEIILSLIVTQTLIKTAYEIVILPLTLRAVRLLRKLEAAN